MPNIWGVVGGVQFALPMATLLGTPFQLLGMDAAGAQLEYKNAFYNNANGQFYVPAGTVAAPSFSFSTELSTGFYKIGAGNVGLSILGTKVSDWNATRLQHSINLQMLGKLIEEAFGADIVAAAAIDLTTATGNYLRITNAAGAINLADLGGATLPAGTEIETHFVITGGSVTLIYDINILNLLGGASVALQDGDVVRWRKTNSANNYWKMVGFARGTASGFLTTKGDLLTGLGSGATGRLAAGTDGQALAASAPGANGLIYIDNPARPVLNINSIWQLDQTGEGGLYTVGPATSQQGPDGWTGQAVAAPGVFKVRTIADPDNAALKCLEITCTTIDAAIAAGDLYRIYTAIEGFDAALLMAGTASALPITIQFKFKTNVLGVYGIAINNSANNRSYVGTINVLDANEHEYSISLTMDTAGAWLYTNGVGLYLSLTLAGGATYQGAAGAWAAGQFLTTAAQVNFMSNVANVAYLKRIQVIPGALVQAYRVGDIQKELAKAQRYYHKTYSRGVVPGAIDGSGTVGTCATGGAVNQTCGGYTFPVAMRANPSITFYSTGTGAAGNWLRNNTLADTTIVLLNSGEKSCIWYISGGQTDSEIIYGHITANARLS